MGEIIPFSVAQKQNKQQKPRHKINQGGKKL